jgi:nitrogen fixation protein FixH
MTITGRTVFLGFAGAFGVIVAVNVTLAVTAVSTFPGLEVANSYVASQSFDADRRAQEALGWSVAASVGASGLALVITGRDGRPADVASVAAVVGRATERADDQAPTLVFDGTAWRAPLVLAPGSWSLWLTARAADGTPFRRRLTLYVRG